MLVAICGSSTRSRAKSAPTEREALHRCLGPYPAGVHEPVHEERELADELAGAALDRARADLDRDRAVLDDEQARALLTRVDEDVTARDLERARHCGDVRERKIVEVREQRQRPQRFDEFGIAPFHGGQCTPRVAAIRCPPACSRP